MRKDDLQLIAQCLAGSLEAFEELVRRYQDRLFTLLSRILSNPEDARDALQDTFLLAYQSLKDFRGRSDFFTWLYRISVNVAIDQKRRHRPLASIHTLLNGQGLDSADPCHTNEPSHALVCAEEAKIVWKALSCLPTQDRAILVLKDMDGLRYSDLATLLGLPIGTVRSRLHRARLRLRELLKAQEIVR